MSEQLLEIGKGLSLNNAVAILYGTGIPGGTTDTDGAPVGSSYHNVSDGSQWQKTANSGNAGDWQEQAGKEAAIMVEHIASMGVILDQVPVKLADQFAWMVTAINEGDTSNKFSAIIHASHNGTSIADATEVRYGLSSIVKHGAKINGLAITATLTGTGNGQMMNLHVSSGTMVTFISYRMVKNVAGSNTVVLGGANLSNHIADGAAHLQSWQNTLLDGLDQSLTAAEINRTKGVSAPIQGQLDGKTAVGHTHTMGDISGYTAPVQAYDLVFPMFDKPTASEVVFRMRTPRAFTISNVQTNGRAIAGAASTGAATFSLRKNGSQIGTVSFSAGNVTGTISISTAVSVAVGDKLDMVAPASVDATLADVDFAFIAELA